MNKKQAEKEFKANVLPWVKERYEEDGKADYIARTEAWITFVDMWIKEGRLPDKAGNWVVPDVCRKRVKKEKKEEVQGHEIMRRVALDGGAVRWAQITVWATTLEGLNRKSSGYKAEGYRGSGETLISGDNVAIGSIWVRTLYKEI